MQIYSKNNAKNLKQNVHTSRFRLLLQNIYIHLAVNVVTFVEEDTSGSATKPLLSVPLTEDEQDKVYEAFFDISEELASTTPE